MTPRFSAGQNKIRLIAVFLFTVLLALAFQFYQGNRPDTGHAASNTTETVDESLFIGLRHASAREVRAALPESVGKPTLLEFSSRLCHDCQRMKPVLAKLTPRHPQVVFKQVDALDDRKKLPAVFRTFKPVSVPMLVFIDPQGEIRNVLYNYQSPETIEAALIKLEQQSQSAARSTAR
jgi:thiol:disulfide interchange protein